MATGDESSTSGTEQPDVTTQDDGAATNGTAQTQEGAPQNQDGSTPPAPLDFSHIGSGGGSPPASDGSFASTAITAAEVAAVGMVGYFGVTKIAWPFTKWITQPVWRPIQFVRRLISNKQSASTSPEATAKAAAKQAKIAAEKKSIEATRNGILERERGRNPFLRDAATKVNPFSGDDEALYQDVLKSAARDPEAFKRGLSYGDIQHYIRERTEGAGYHFDGANTSAPADEATLENKAKSFLGRMQKEGRLGTTPSGMDTFNGPKPRFMSDVPAPEVPRGLAGKEWRTDDFLKGLRRERPAEFRMAELGVAERQAGAGWVGRAWNWATKPFSVGKALPAALKDAAPGVEVLAKEGVFRVGMRRLGTVGMVAAGSWDVIQSIRHHESMKKVEVTAGDAAGSAIGGWAAFEGGALLGGAIGAGFFGVGSIPGALIGGAVGLGASIVGAHYGGKIGSSIVRHFTGRPIEEQAEQMKKYFDAGNDANAWKPGSDLAKQAMKDGFGYVNGKQVTDDGGITALKDAHWAASLGFANSNEYHEVQIAAAKAHKSEKELINIIQNEVRKETKNPKAVITGSDVAGFLRDHPNANINQLVAASTQPPRDAVAAGPVGGGNRQETAAPSLSHDKMRDALGAAQVTEIENFLKTQAVAAGSVGEKKGFKDIAGKNYLEAYHGNLSLAVQAYNIDHGNYEKMPEKKRNGQRFEAKDDLDGNTDGPRSLKAYQNMLNSDAFKQWDASTRVVPVPNTPTPTPAPQAADPDAAASNGMRGMTRPLAQDVPLSQVPAAAIKAGDGATARDLQLTRPELGAPISARMSEVDKRTAKDERKVIADLANDPHAWVLDKQYKIYDATQERRNIDDAFSCEVTWKPEKEGDKIKHLYFVFTGDPKEAGAFFAALQESEKKHHLQAAPTEFRDPEEQAFIANARPGNSQERARFNLFSIFHLHHNHEKADEKKWQKIGIEANGGGYVADPRTGKVSYTEGPQLGPDNYAWQGPASRNIKLAALKTNFQHGEDQGTDSQASFDVKAVMKAGQDLANAVNAAQINNVAKFLKDSGFEYAADQLRDTYGKRGTALAQNEGRNIHQWLVDNQAGKLVNRNGASFADVFTNAFDVQMMNKNGNLDVSAQARNARNVASSKSPPGTPFFALNSAGPYN